MEQKLVIFKILIFINKNNSIFQMSQQTQLTTKEAVPVFIKLKTNNKK